MTTPRRLAIILHSRAPGGLESLALRLAADWSGHGYDVHLLTVAEARQASPLPEGVRETCLGHPLPAGNPLSRLLQLWGTLRRLRAVLQEIAPEIVISHGDRTNVLALLAHRGMPGRRIIAEHNDVRHHQIGRIWEMARRHAYPLADRIIGVSQGVIDGMPDPWRAKGRAIPNPVPRLSAPPDVVQNPNRITGLGRLSFQKGFDLLIEAFAKIAARKPALRLVIHGEGPERPALEQEIERLGLREKVTLPGRSDDVARDLASGGLFVFPSRYEGFGLALGEAMGLGLPVIAADCESGPREMIRDGENGLLVPSGDADALAKAILQLLEDPGLARRLGEAARALPDQFSEERWLAAWREEVEATAP